MKKYLLVLTLCFTAGILSAQSLSLSQEMFEFSDDTEKVDYGDAIITNVSSETITVACRMERRCHADDGSGVSVCWGGTCLPATSDDIVIDMQQFLVTLAPGETYDGSAAQLFNFVSEGSNWRLYFYDVNNPSDEIYYEVRWGTCSESNVIVSVDENEGEALGLFPNPTNEILNVTGASGQQFVIFNIVGEIVASGNITTSREVLNVSHLSEGLYFLQAGNSTKQFVVK
jgi:hypothetical protein